MHPVPARIAMAFRVTNPSLFWFVASAWHTLAASCPDPTAAIDTAVDSCWTLRSNSPAFQHVVTAIHAAGIAAVPTGPQGRKDITIDNIASVTIATRDKALLTLLLWFLPSTMWSTTLPAGAPSTLQATWTR
jgi:hypothetical protein